MPVPRRPAPPPVLITESATQTNPIPAVVHRRLSQDPAALAAAKAAVRPESAAAAGSGSGESRSYDGPGRLETKVAVFNGLNQDGIRSADEGSNNTPPDTTGAIGPAHYVEFVNTLIAVYDRNLATMVAPTAAQNFTQTTNCGLSDPQILWDPVNNRWHYAMLVIGQSGCAIAAGQYGMAFGWSNTTNPASGLATGSSPTGWCKYFVSTGTSVYDFPKIGHNDGYMAIGFNVFTSGTTFAGASVWTFPLPALGSTVCPGSLTPTMVGPLTNQDSSQTFTAVPVNVFGPSADGWIVSAHTPTGAPARSTMIELFKMDNTGAITRVGALTVNPFGYPANVPQPGTSYLIDSSDTRLQQAVAMPDSSRGGAMGIWLTHAVYDPAPGPNVAPSSLRWYELLPATLAVAQQGFIHGGPNSFAWNGSISPSSSGSEAAASYNIVYPSGSTYTMPELHAASRRVTTPPNQLGTFISLASSTGFAADFSCPDPVGCRWGDYAAMSPDSANPNVVWGSNQYQGPNPSDTSAAWRTRNFALATTTGGNYTPLAPSRILDTRDGTGGFLGSLGPNSSIAVQVLNRGGVPSGGVGAVALNVTSDGATDSSFLTVFPGPGNQPLVSNLNFVQGQTIANLVIVNVGLDGKVRVYNAQGNVNVIIDVQGWFSNMPAEGSAGQFHPVPPARLLDTRTSTGGHPYRMAAGETYNLPVAGVAGLPALANISSVIINLTVSGPSQAAFLTAYPGGTRPNASNLNVQAGVVQPNRVAVKINPSDGTVSIFLSDGSADVIVDVNGWFGTSLAGAGSVYNGLVPARIYDSRWSGQLMLSQGEARPLQIYGMGGVPSGASAVVANVAVTDSNIGSFMTVYPSDAATPLASDLNWPTAATIPNLVVVKIGADGQVRFYNALGSTNFVVDVSGWFGTN
jgi:hypothetical protein